MSPDAPCPECGRITAFHDEEMEGVDDGSVVCATCHLMVVESAFVLEIASGEHDHLIPNEEDEEDHT